MLNRSMRIITVLVALCILSISPLAYALKESDMRKSEDGSYYEIDMQSGRYVLVGNYVLSSDQKTLIYAITEKMKKIETVPSTVTTIEVNAFIRCPIEMLILPNVTKIEPRALDGCTDLKMVVFQSSEKITAEDMFSYPYPYPLYMLFLYTGAKPTFSDERIESYKVTGIPKLCKSQTVNRGERATFSMEFPGLQNASYQWVKRESATPGGWDAVDAGAAKNILVINSANGQDLTQYWLKVKIGDKEYNMPEVELYMNVSFALDAQNDLQSRMDEWGISYFHNIKSLTITGTISQEDLDSIYNALYSCETIDLSGARGTNLKLRCEEYLAGGGTDLKVLKLPRGVISIGPRVLSECEELTTINLPDVTSIGRLAFAGCSNLKSVNMPKAESIDYSAFSGCTALESVTLPESLSVMRDNAFGGCTSLKNINVQSKSFAFQNNMLLSADKNTLYFIVPSAVSGEVVLPDTITQIAGDAFWGCNLSAITMPNVMQIRENAFWGCTSLRSVDLPKARLIGPQAFGKCTNLKKVTLGAQGPFSIALSAFSDLPDDAKFVYTGDGVFPYIDGYTVVDTDGEKPDKAHYKETVFSGAAFPEFVFPAEGTIIKDKTKILSATKKGKSLATIDKDAQIELIGVEGKYYKIKWQGTEAFVPLDNVQVVFDIPVIAQALRKTQAWYTYRKGDLFYVFGRSGKYLMVVGEWDYDYALAKDAVIE